MKNYILSDPNKLIDIIAIFIGFVSLCFIFPIMYRAGKQFIETLHWAKEEWKRIDDEKKVK